MNDFTVSQASSVLNSIVAQATGSAAITPITNNGDFVAVAQTLLRTGYDTVINAISQVFSRSIFAYRDYNAENSDLEMDLPRYGNAVRKLSPVAKTMQDDARFIYPAAYDAVNYPGNPYGDGVSVDHYKINKQDVLQTNFYGTAVYQQRYTIFKDQFDLAFSSIEEFGRFAAMLMGERKNDRESYKEGVARGLQANFIGALLDENNNNRVIHLLTEYNTLTNITPPLTASTVYQPANFAPFMRWAYSRVKTIARLMAARSEMFQTAISGKRILRHTSAENLRIAMFAPMMEQFKAMVLSDTYHDEYLQRATLEEVNYWQAIETPNTIQVTPIYTDTTGAVTTGSAVNNATVVGLLHDRDAMGYAFTNTWSATTPLNIDGGYWNEAYHANVKTIQDNTEKAVVLCMD